MKILIISDLAPPFMGGGESYVINLGAHLTKLGHEVHWLTSKIPNTKDHEDYRGIHIHRIPVLFSKKFLFPGRQTFPFMTMLQDLDFVNDMDIVQANTFVGGYAGWRIAQRYDKPSVLFCHEFFGDRWNILGHNILEKRIYPMIENRMAQAPYDAYACPSEYAKSTMIEAGAPEELITVIPHGINHDLFNPRAEGAYFRKKLGLDNFKLFGFIGRLRIKKTAHSKNLSMLLQATKIVVKEMPDARLILAGAGYEEMEPLVKKMSLEKHVLYIGDIPYENNPSFLRMCDVVVCPALSDGFCFLLAEASSCGRPVVTTNLTAHLDRVMHGRNGLLVEPTAEGIASGIIKVLSDEEMIRNFGREGANCTTRFTWEESARKHLQLYAEVAERYS